MRTGILTFHRAHNCGAMLQCYALQTVLTRMGHDVSILDCNRIGEEHRFQSIGRCSLKRYVKKFLEFLLSLGAYDLRMYRFNAFRRRHIRMTKPIGLQDKFPKEYDYYIIGSDQVLQPNLTKEYRQTFLLGRVEEDCKKLSYAASFGYSSLPEEFRSEYRDALARFKQLMIREPSGIDIIHNELGLKAKANVVLDPTLLLAASDYESVEKSVRTPREYVLVYSIGGADKKLRDVSKRIASEMGVRVVFVNACRRHYVDVPFSDYLSVSPDRLAYLIHHALCVVTTSFHGVAFSLIYKRPFVAIRPSQSKVGGRIPSLLERIGLSGNIIGENDDLDTVQLMGLLQSDFGCAIQKLEELKKDSLECLKRSIEGGM